VQKCRAAPTQGKGRRPPRCTFAGRDRRAEASRALGPPSVLPYRHFAQCAERVRLRARSATTNYAASGSSTLLLPSWNLSQDLAGFGLLPSRGRRIPERLPSFAPDSLRNTCHLITPYGNLRTIFAHAAFTPFAPGERVLAATVMGVGSATDATGTITADGNV
jgi:hypothetical protein